MKGFGEINQSNKEKIVKIKKKENIDQLITKAFELQAQGKKLEAAKYYQYLIKQGTKDCRVFSNYGAFLNEIGKRKESELSCRKAIELNPNYAHAHCNLGNALRDLGKLKEAGFYYDKAIQLNPNLGVAYSNLGTILRDLGKLKEAEFYYLKAIQLNTDLSIAFFCLSNLKLSNTNTIWRNQLFSKNLLKNKSQIELINIYFARANILHKEQNYKDSSIYLKLANNLKLDLKPTKPEVIFNKSKILLIESNKQDINLEKDTNFPESIFIVGMFRSGSTLLESILSMRTDVYDLGEIDFLEKSFFESKKSKKRSDLSQLYWEKINNKTKLNITTNKNLFNYQFTGIIAQKIPNSKIIHCFRNPLDNILSIYKAHFAERDEYSSSLLDIAKVYLDQEEVMTQYKKRFRSKIYDLNYDLLVSNPTREIKSLITWLGWKWDDKYYSPHLNPRSVTTASTVQVRSPINTKSLGGWKNYKDMLRPAMEIITQTDKYKDLKY
jgi:tetratricopeptide (TPR) repeat protein